MNFDDRMGSCRDKGRMWGRVGAWCLSWWQREPLGFREARWSPPNEDKHQAPSTPPLVPTGPWVAGTSMDRIARFGRQNSSGYDWFWSLMFIIDSSAPASRQGAPQEERAEVRTIVVFSRWATGSQSDPVVPLRQIH